MAQENALNFAAIRTLQKELRDLNSSPVEGFTVTCDDENIFEWTVAIFGPPGTLYQGGYFKAKLEFPSNYPFSPPKMTFLSRVTHPNVYENGELCISILHPPTADETSGENPEERWNPTQSVRTILLSVISLLNEPNTFSPANVSASVNYRNWKESNGANDEYAKCIKAEVEASKAEAARDNVVVPQTLSEYCIKPSTGHSTSEKDETSYLLHMSDDEDEHEYSAEEEN